MRVLIIEDNPIIAQALKRNLKDYYVIDICRNGRDGLFEAQTTCYDTILLDLALPDMSGEKICRTLRKDGIDTPIIVLSGKGEVKDKISLLDMGADDYVTKPFNIYELRARIDVAMRHTSNNGPAGRLVVNELELDPSSRTVKHKEQLIILRRKEFDLLEYLMRDQGHTLTRPMILEHIWDTNENLWANVVDVHVKHLRDKVGRPYKTKLIKTVHGVGYKIEGVKKEIKS